VTAPSCLLTTATCCVVASLHKLVLFIMVFNVFGKLRRNKHQPREIEEKATIDTSIGDTIPTKHQFYLETRVKKAPEPVEKLLLSFGQSPGDGIRTSSSVSSLSSNSASTYDLPRRKSIEDTDDDSTVTARAAYPLAICAPQYFELAAPPLKDAKYVPTVWSTLFECCHPSVLQVEPTYSVARTDETKMGRFLASEDPEDPEDWETNEVVGRKKGIFRGWKGRRSACGGTDSALFTEEQ